MAKRTSTSSTTAHIAKMRSLSESVSKRNKKIHSSSSPAASKSSKRSR